MNNLKPKHLKALRTALRLARAWNQIGDDSLYAEEKKAFKKTEKDCKEAFSIINANLPKVGHVKPVDHTLCDGECD